MMKRKVVLITGASSGLGLETAYKLLEKGHIVYGGARRVERMTEIKARGGHILPLDVTNEESMVSCVNTVLEKEGRIDILINNAGYGSCGTIEDVPIKEVKSQYEVNVFGLGRMTQLVLPGMRKRRSGRIVNISSMGGRFTTPFCGWYHSTKYAVEAISDALRMEVRPYGIDVAVVEPGMIKTDWGIIAARHIRRYSGKGAYAENADHAARFYEQRYGNGNVSLTDPRRMANVIVKAATEENPRVRYLSGKYAKSLVLLKTVLSDRFYQVAAVFFMKLERKL